MITLIPYSSEHESEMLLRIPLFFGFHQALIEEACEAARNTANNDSESRKTLAEWLTYPSALYVITDNGSPVGFIRICFRGPTVAWIEDIYVDPEKRGRGIASEAIKEIEDIIRQTPEYTAVCMDVAPRNSDALRLYHKLGYTDISLITVRKELGESKRDKPIQLLGFDFNY